MADAMPDLTSVARKPMPPSPCIGICDMDLVTGRCSGCARTADEIDAWREADDAYRDAVWAALPARIAAMGVNIRRLSWSATEILDFVETSLRKSRGTWVFGVYGALAEIGRDPDEVIEVKRDGAVIEVVTPRAALRIAAERWVRALAWRETEDHPERLVLVVPKGRVGEVGPATLTALGADDDALLPGDAGLPRFDLGLGRAEARFTVRSRNDHLTAALADATGTAWPDHLAQTSGPVLSTSPVRVIETALGRAEVATPIPQPRERSPDGPHTHLLPDTIARGLTTPPMLHLPEAYRLGCLFYPAA